jgi:hypothetical protein
MGTQAPAAFLEKDQKRDIAYNGPMRSGLVIDSRSLLLKGYEKYQTEILQVLNPAGSGEWYAPHMQNRSNKMQIDTDTRRGRTIIPGYFIGRTLAGEALGTILKHQNLQRTVEDPDGRAVFYIDSIDIRLYDMGYGSVSFTGQIEGQTDLDIEAYRDAAEKISSELSRYRSVFLSTFEHVARTVKPEFVSLNFHNNLPSSDYWRNCNLGQSVGDLFWVHRVFIVECASHQQFTRKREMCKKLVYSEAEEVLEDASINPQHLAVYPGNGNSVVVFEKGAAKPLEVSTLHSMVRAQNIFYVTAEDIDRDMFYLSNQLDRSKHSTDMKLLEAQSEIIIDYQSKVTFFKGVYDDYDNSLDPQGLKIWHALEKAWSTRDRFENMNTKLELVEKIYNRIRENMNHLQNKRIGVFMLAFTLISTLSVIVDTIDFTTQGDALPPPSTLRIGVLVSMLVVVVFLAVGLMKSGKRKL